MSLPHPESQPHNQGSVLLGSAQSLLGRGEWGSYTKDLSCSLLHTLQHSLLSASFAKGAFRTVPHKQ